MEIIKFEPVHLMELIQQDVHKTIAEGMTIERAEFLSTVDTYSIVDGSKVYLVGGAIKFHEHRAEAWAMIDQSCRKDFLGVFNKAKQWLDGYKIRRLEATIDHEFEAGHRWIKALGFNFEAGPLKKYRMNGDDVSLYVRIQ
jgi:hypothetical protein